MPQDAQPTGAGDDTKQQRWPAAGPRVGPHSLNELNDTGVIFMPGSAMGMEGFVRIGYANSPEIIDRGLELTSQFLAKQN